MNYSKETTKRNDDNACFRYLKHIKKLSSSFYFPDALSSVDILCAKMKVPYMYSKYMNI